MKFLLVKVQCSHPAEFRMANIAWERLHFGMLHFMILKCLRGERIPAANIANVFLLCLGRALTFMHVPVLIQAMIWLVNFATIGARIGLLLVRLCQMDEKACILSKRFWAQFALKLFVIRMQEQVILKDPLGHKSLRANDTNVFGLQMLTLHVIAQVDQLSIRVSTQITDKGRIFLVNRLNVFLEAAIFDECFAAFFTAVFAWLITWLFRCASWLIRCFQQEIIYTASYIKFMIGKMFKDIFIICDIEKSIFNLAREHLLWIFLNISPASWWFLFAIIFTSTHVTHWTLKENLRNVGIYWNKYRRLVFRPIYFKIIKIDWCLCLH